MLSVIILVIRVIKIQLGFHHFKDFFKNKTQCCNK